MHSYSSPFASPILKPFSQKKHMHNHSSTNIDGDRNDKVNGDNDDNDHNNDNDVDMERHLPDFREAGKLAGKIREQSKSLISVGEPLLDIAETIEKIIIEEGGRPAFPVNISINEIAAHNTPEFGSEIVLGEKDLVKIDLGVEINGALADTAYTIDLSDENGKLIEASETALAKAISAIKPGIRTGSIGEIIEETIKGFGYLPISNLSGHMIKPNELHAGIDIPNVKTENAENTHKFREGEIFAIEPFVTNGEGFVEELEQVEIFSVFMPAQIRMRQSRKIAEYVLANFGTAPFAERWIRKEFSSRLLVSAALREMLQSHLLRGYPILREKGRGLVAQTEHTIRITADGCEILTKG